MTENKRLKILHISDTHGFHGNMEIFKDVDLVIHSGDCSNWRDPYRNEPEILEFLHWYGQLDIPYKVYVAGNHDTSIEARLVREEQFTSRNIIYLNNEYVTIEGHLIYGSPCTPTFGQWAFMKSRNKIHHVWDEIPEQTSILVTHGPPKGLLDVSDNPDGTLVHCGCSNLRKQLDRLKALKLHCFGHIHNRDVITNSGLFTLPSGLIISNASAVEDGKFNGTIVNHGNLITL